MSADHTPAALTNRLGFLLKHAQARLTELTESALSAFGIEGREWAVLLSIDDRDPLPQRQIARRLHIDRTTMVTLIDGLEDKGLVERRRDPDDRRKNVVVLTDAGRDTLRRATAAGDAAERQFLAPLAQPDVERLQAALRDLVFVELERRPGG